MSIAITAKALTGHWGREGSGFDLDGATAELLVAAAIAVVLLVALVVSRLDRRWAEPPAEPSRGRIVAR